MGALGLGQLAGQRPFPALKVDVLPAHACRLVAALPQDQQDLHIGAEGFAQAGEGGPQGGDLVGLQIPFAGLFGGGRLDLESRGSVQDAAFDAPVEELADIGQDPVGRLHPLLIVAVFVVVFLEIHPFQDGNGRLIPTGL